MSFFTILQTIFIEPLKLVFEIIFSVANKITYNSGLSIIVLSLVINVLVLPLYKRADAMQEAARDIDNKLKDGVAHIKKTFTGDERMMILQTYYQQNHYKPTDALNGSVSLLLQIPFFMAAYQFLSGLEILQSSSLGPIANLGAPDGLLAIGSLTVNVLPILMTLINVVSSAIYLKGFPMKTKVQLYGMAAFFLVFLYNSPAGLVFYWTLNNLFSLVKTIFYKLKNPLKIVAALASALGLAVLAYGLFFYDTTSVKRKVVVLAMGLAAQLPMIYVLLRSRCKGLLRKEPIPNRNVFLWGSLLLTVTVGLLIPSAVLASSPQEFVDANYFYHPLWFLVSTTCMAAGIFLVWLRVFYWLASPSGKCFFDKAVWILCGVVIIDYMAFGTDLGLLSSSLQFESGLSFSRTEQLLNLAVLAVAAVIMLLFVNKWPKITVTVLLTATLAIGGMGILNMSAIYTSIARVQDQMYKSSLDIPQIKLSKTGKNVVVLMMDRAFGEYVPYLMNEKPELQEQFSGFTWYKNTLAYGHHTNVAVPAIFGGYEYTPLELNKRDQETLVSKHNESLKVMPVLFDENGYDVTVCDPVYANYQWYTDTSIYDDYPDINAYVTEGAFTGNDGAQQQILDNTSRNFFVYSLMKSVPLIAQSYLYSDGTYNRADVFISPQVQDGVSKSVGVNTLFMDAYYVLTNLPAITQISQEEAGSFLMMVNNTTHEPVLLSAPDYTPAMQVDNTAYDAANTDRFTYNGVALNMDQNIQMAMYHANMAAMLQLGSWFDYMRENGVYDNTRIIIVGDHGYGNVLHNDALTVDRNGEVNSLEAHYPMLLVKDFGSTEFTVSQEKMTTADVPTLATADLLQDPVNPFTGNPIDSSYKNTDEIWLCCTGEWEVSSRNTNTTFLPCYWARVGSGDYWDTDNWTFTSVQEVIPTGALD